MGHCISDNTMKDERFEIQKQFNTSQEKEFCEKNMDTRIAAEVEKAKRATFSDGLGKQDTSKSIITIQY